MIRYDTSLHHCHAVDMGKMEPFQRNVTIHKIVILTGVASSPHIVLA
jgi:hypothetical protein